MSSVPGDVAPGPILPARLRGIPWSPAEGWLTFGFVALMALTVAWSLDDSAWVLGRPEWGDFYAWAALLATAVGFAGAKAGWPRWAVHLVGAAVAALVVPVMVGSVLVEDGGSPGTLFRATAEATVSAWRDLAILDRPSTNETGHYLLTIGLVVWSVGQFAAYAVFGHRRPLDAVIVVGVVLIGNMAITIKDQLGYLVIFTIASLAVLARTHAFEEETTWVRRRIGDGGAVRAIYLRGGAAFIALAVFGSLVLTASASSSPLAGAWSGFDRTIVAWSQDLQRFLPFGGASRPIGFGFGRQAQIGGQWVSDNRLAVTIQVPPGDLEPYYWRAVTFDRYDLNSWSWTSPYAVDREPASELLETFGDEPTDTYARREVPFNVFLEGTAGNFLLSPLDPISVDQPTSVQTVGGLKWMSAVELSADTYSVRAAVPIISEEGNGLTANRLRAAGEDYPDEIRRLYLSLPENAMGPESRRLLNEVVEDAGANPFDIATELERRLSRSPEFEYNVNIGPICEGFSVAECFAQHKRGFCLHYATTMAVLLREQGIPARLVEGFLPGDRDPATGLETIRASGAHAWVEVWFPGFGWYTFDPTGGGRNQTPTLPAGPTVTPPPSVLPSFGSVRPDERATDPVNQGPNSNPNSGGGTTPRESDSPAVLVVVALLLLVGTGAAGFAAWQRGPRGEVSADSVWGGIARTAARFGFGPRPHETVYEYAGALGEVMPAHRPELQSVARAKVEVAYGRAELGDDRRQSLRNAQRRLRVALLRLALRRKDRRRGR